MPKLDITKKRAVEKQLDKLSSKEERQALLLPRIFDRMESIVDMLGEPDESEDFSPVIKPLESILKETQRIGDKKFRARVVDFFTDVTKRLTKLDKSSSEKDMLRELRTLNALLENLEEKISKERRVVIEGASAPHVVGINNKLSQRINPAIEENQFNIIGSATTTFATVGTVSAVVLTATATRRDTELVNDSDDEIYLSRGGTAVVGSGIRLNRGGGTYNITSRNLYRGVISAIAPVAGKNLTISEGVE